METWIHSEVASISVLPALLDWLMANGVTRPAEHREIRVEPAELAFWRHGAAPENGQAWVGHWRHGGSRVKVDAHGRHAGDHRDELAEFGPERRPLTWRNLHPAKSIERPQMDAAAQMLHDGGVMAALALMDEKLHGLPFSNVGGLPKVERELLGGVVSEVASLLLGDTWVTDLRVACEALKAQRSGSDG
jgi:hypothetical protein